MLRRYLSIARFSPSGFLVTGTALVNLWVLYQNDVYHSTSGPVFTKLEASSGGVLESDASASIFIFGALLIGGLYRTTFK